MTLAPCARRSHLLTIARAAKIGATKIRHLCGHCATIFPKRNGRQPQRTHVDWLPLVGPVVHCAAPLQLHASVLSGEPPVGFGMLFVAVGLPGLDLFLQRLLIRDSPAKLVQGHTLSLRTTNHRKGDLGVRLRYISQYLSMRSRRKAMLQRQPHSALAVSPLRSRHILDSIPTVIYVLTVTAKRFESEWVC